MPAPINEAPSRAGSFTSHHSGPAQRDTEYSYNDGRSHAPPSTNNQSIGGPPAANPSSNDHGRQSSGGHSTTHSNAPYETRTNETHGPVTVSNHHDTTPSIPPTSTNAHGGGGYSVHTPHTHPISRGDDSEAEESPVFIEPLPASDYDKMSPPHSVEGASLSTRVMRVGEFFQELYQLPWVGRHGVITADYVPTGGKGKPTTWYPGGVRNGNLHGRPDFDIDGTPEAKENTSVRSREPNSGRGWRRDPSTYYSRDYDYRDERERERQREMDRDRERDRDRQRQRTRSPAYDERSSPPYDFYERTRSPPHEPPPRARTTAADYDQYRNRSPPGPYGYSSNDRPRHRDRDRDRDRQRDREHDRDHERDWERDRHRRRRDRDRERDRERDRGGHRDRDRERGSDRPRYPNGYAPDHRDAHPLYIYPNPAHPNTPVLPGQPSVMPGEARPLYVIAPTPPRPSVPPPASTGGKMDRGGSKSGEGRARGERAGRDTKDGSEVEVEAPGGFHAYAMSRAPTNHDGRGAEPV